MSRISVLLLFSVIFYSTFYITTSLPVTSKPIENTPEHLAWEAWIMVPSHYDKSKKITPKSIFIVPNGTNGGNGLGGNNNGGNGKGSAFMPQIQCPPGHTIDNFKCIPTVSIDQSQILITRLTNLVHSTDKYNGTNTDINDSYDYDYEYDTYETDETKHFQNTGIRHDNENPSPLSLSSSSASSSSDYNGEPLKINLSLGKFPPVDKDEENNNNDKTGTVDNLSSSEDGDISVEIENKGIKVQPFRDKETETTTTKITQTSTLSTSTNSVDKSNSYTTISTRDTTIHTTTTVFPDKLDSSISDKISPVRSRTVTANVTTNTFPILSPSETEMLANNQTNSTTTTKDIQDYDLDDQSTSRTTTINDEMELITTFDEPKSTDFKEDIEKESLIVQDGNSKTTTIEVETTETEEPIFSTTPLDENEDGNTDTMLVEEPSSSDASKTTIVNSSPSNKPATRMQENPTNTDYQISNSHIDENQSTNNGQPRETSNSHKDAAPLMETVESNNRFVYHHLGSTNSVSNSPQQKIETTTTSPDIRNQLRIINQIVEENKRRAQQQHSLSSSSSSSLPNSKIIRFPQNNENNYNSNYHQNRYDNVRSDFVRFPTDPVSSSSRLISTQVHHKSPQDSFYPSSDKKLYQPSSLHPSIIPPPAISSSPINGDYRQNSKPFWWLPTGWEVDRTGNRPMMVRFWSRIPVEPSTYTTNSNSNSRISTIPATSMSTSSTTTTSRYRENSRSPTENLYRQEIFAQQKNHHQQHQQQHYQQDDIYSVLGAKQWKHNNR